MGLLLDAWSTRCIEQFFTVKKSWSKIPLFRPLKQLDQCYYDYLLQSNNIQFQMYFGTNFVDFMVRQLSHKPLNFFIFFLQTEAEEATLNKVRSKKTMKKYEARQKTKAVEQALEDQFATGRVLGKLRPRIDAVLYYYGFPSFL